MNTTRERVFYAHSVTDEILAELGDERDNPGSNVSSLIDRLPDAIEALQAAYTGLVLDTIHNLQDNVISNGNDCDYLIKLVDAFRTSREDARQTLTDEHIDSLLEHTAHLDAD